MRTGCFELYFDFSRPEEFLSTGKIFSELIYLPGWKRPLLANHTISKDNIRLECAQAGKESKAACRHIHTYSVTVDGRLPCVDVSTSGYAGCAADVAIWNAAAQTLRGKMIYSLETAAASSPRVAAQSTAAYECGADDLVGFKVSSGLKDLKDRVSSGWITIDPLGGFREPVKQPVSSSYVDEIVSLMPSSQTTDSLPFLHL